MEKDLKYWECYCYCHWKINWVSIDSDDFWKEYIEILEELGDKLSLWSCGWRE